MCSRFPRAEYNRRHALNVLFFEVLQNYEVRTVLKGWDRCLFVPLVPLDFEKAGVIASHQAELLDLFRELGATEMIEHLNRALGEEEAATKALSECQVARDALQRAKGLAQDYADCEVRCRQAREEVAAVDHAIELDQRAIDLIDSGQTKNIHLDRQSLVRAIERHTREKRGRLNTIATSEQRMNEIRAQWEALGSERQGLPPIELTAERIQGSIDEFEAKMAGYRIPVGKIFNRHRVFLSQQLWLRMSPYRIHRMLQRFTVVDRTAGGGGAGEQPICSLVDPQPIGVFGNYLAFRWGFPSTADGKGAHDTFGNAYLEQVDEVTGCAPGEVTREVGLPTSGVFAEAVLGRGLAAEQIDPRFPGWSEKDSTIPILPPRIADLQSRDRGRGIDFAAQDFAPALAQLRAEKLADVSHIEKILGQVGKGAIFRDMGGLAQAVTLAEKLGTLSTESATRAGDRAVQLQSKVLDVFEQVIASDVGKAAVAEFMLPGSGAALLGAREGGGKSPARAGEKDEKPAA